MNCHRAWHQQKEQSIVNKTPFKQRRLCKALAIKKFGELQLRAKFLWQEDDTVVQSCWLLWCCRYVATDGAHLLNGAITSAINGSAVITGSIVGNGMYLSAFYAHITPQYGRNPDFRYQYRFCTLYVAGHHKSCLALELDIWNRSRPSTLIELRNGDSRLAFFSRNLDLVEPDSREVLEIALGYTFAVRKQPLE